MNWMMVGFIVVAIILYSIVYFTNPKVIRPALSSTLYQLFHPAQGFLYTIVAAFLISSMLIIILPKEQISAWIGRESGLKGILIGTGLGTITPGGPILSFPILVAFWKAGTGVGPIIAYLTAWSLFGLQRILIWEIPFLGPKFVLLRVGISLIIPVILGVVGQWLSRFVGL